MTTEQLHTIEVPGLPDGWRDVAYRQPKTGEYYWEFGIGNSKRQEEWDFVNSAHIVIEKIQPRRITLEDTGEVRQPEPGDYVLIDGNYHLCVKPKHFDGDSQIWRVVEKEK